MASYSAVSDVSNELLAILQEGMVDPGPPEITILDSDQVGLASPDDAGSLRLTLYLYRVVESDHLKNTGRQEVDVTRFRRASLGLDLFYLLTAHPTNGNGASESQDPHLILGRAMQTLHDHAVLDGPGEGEAAYVSIYPQSMDDVTNIWNTFENGSFQPSVSYLVSPVVIESTAEETVTRVVDRHLGRPPAQEGGGG